MPTYPANSRQQPMFTRHPFGEPKWQLASQSEFDGLAPSQIVRYLNAGDRGFEDAESQSRLAARLDATPDADNLVTNPAPSGESKGVTVDAHRYVVDPIVDDRHQFTGLYTGGPIRVANEPTRDGGSHKRCTQVLTRTFCAGHGYWKDEAGRYHAAWPTAFDEDGKPTAWTARNPEADEQVHYEAGDPTGLPVPEDADIREYMSADDALKFHRPALDSRLMPYLVLQDKFPGSFTREVYWREFTHESIAQLEELGKDRARLEAVVKWHFTGKVAPQVLDAHVRLDPQTNTVVFVCSLLYVQLGEPKTPEELLDLPFVAGPCTRETLRMFGWNQLRDGEGYKYTHVFTWPRLKDTPEVRAALEFVKDNKPVAAQTDESGAEIRPAYDSWIVALLSRHGETNPGYAGYETSKPEPVLDNSQADNTGRLTAPLTTPKGSAPDSDNQGMTLATAPAQFYRIAKQGVSVDQDGSLSFSIVLARSEWHGADDGKDWESNGQRQLSSVSSPDGWGIAETRTIPSVPRENAIPTMIGIKAATLEIITAKHQTEGAEGHSDVSFTRAQLYDYVTKIPANTQNPFGIDFDATSQGYNPYPRPTYNLTYERVSPGAVSNLISKIKSKLGGDPAISLTYHPEGYYTVWARGTGRTPRHVEEWLVSANWFHHQTVEHWFGVTLGTNDGERGFYDTVTVDPETGAETKSGWHSLASIRGDLDANWMGSLATNGATIDYTTGHGTGGHAALDPQPSHGDVHTVASGSGTSVSHGWDNVADDPDATGGNADAAGDAADKARSHVITSVRVSTNEDGTYNLTIERDYPHQRVWVWRERQARKKGDWRYVYRAHYRNWPSRHAIYNDLVTNFVTWINSTYGESVNLSGEDWTWNYSPSVNIFGLVDDGGVTIAPVIWNKRQSKKHPDKTKEGLSTVYDYRWKTQKPPLSGGARTDPSAAESIAPAFKPMLGYYFCVERRPHYNGFYKTYTKASLVCQQIGGDIDKIAEVPGGYAFSHKGAWEHGWWYNGDMPKAENNWGTAGDGTREDNLKKIFTDAGLNNEEAEALVSHCSGNMTQADWEYWFGQVEPDTPAQNNS